MLCCQKRKENKIKWITCFDTGTYVFQGWWANCQTKFPDAQQSASSELRSSITIGEALEATVPTAGNKPVDYGDAAAIQAAEVRATGRTNIIPDGVAAADWNARATKDEDKTKLADILSVYYIYSFFP